MTSLKYFGILDEDFIWRHYVHVHGDVVAWKSLVDIFLC